MYDLSKLPKQFNIENAEEKEKDCAQKRRERDFMANHNRDANACDLLVP